MNDDYTGYTTGQWEDTPVVNEGNVGGLEAQQAMTDYSPYTNTGESLVTAAETGAIPENSTLADILTGGNYGGYTTGSDGNATTPSQVAAAQSAYSAWDTSDSLVDRIKKAWDFGNNPANAKSPLVQMLLAGMTSAQKDSQDKAKVERAAQIDKDKIAANSASVAGIAPVKGIIQKKLTRLGGAPVFDNGGSIKR